MFCESQQHCERTRDELGRRVWPLDSKKDRNRSRISAPLCVLGYRDVLKYISSKRMGIAYGSQLRSVCRDIGKELF